MAFFEDPNTLAEQGSSEADVPFLAELSPPDWERLIELSERRRFQAGDVVMASGDVDRSLYFLASGSVEVYLRQGHKERSVQVLGPGSVLGEIAFFDGKPRSASVRALTDTELLRLSADAFEVLSARHPDLGRKILTDLGRVLALRLRQTEARHGG